MNSTKFTPPLNEQNLKILYSLAKKYGHDNLYVECIGERKTLLTNDEILVYEEYFKKLEKINGQIVKIVPSTSKRQRAASFTWEQKEYNQGIQYDGNNFKIKVYWKKKNETGDIFDVEGGLYGNSYYDRPWNDVPPLYFSNIIIYSMESYSRELNGISGERIYITLKSDYVTEMYNMVNGEPSILPYYRISFKVAAVGHVDTNQMIGQFTIQNSGEGTWWSREID